MLMLQRSERAMCQEPRREVQKLTLLVSAIGYSIMNRSWCSGEELSARDR